MITDHISVFLYKNIFFYRYIVEFSWHIGQILFIALWIYLIKYKKISGQKTALIGFILLIVTMFLNIFGMDDKAGLTAQYVFILFTMSFIQEFYHFLKYENK